MHIISHRLGFRRGNRIFHYDAMRVAGIVKVRSLSPIPEAPREVLGLLIEQERLYVTIDPGQVIPPTGQYARYCERPRAALLLNLPTAVAYAIACDEVLGNVEEDTGSAIAFEYSFGDAG